MYFVVEKDLWQEDYSGATSDKSNCLNPPLPKVYPLPFSHQCSFMRPPLSRLLNHKTSESLHCTEPHDKLAMYRNETYRAPSNKKWTLPKLCASLSAKKLKIYQTCLDSTSVRKKLTQTLPFQVIHLFHRLKDVHSSLYSLITLLDKNTFAQQLLIRCSQLTTPVRSMDYPPMTLKI